MSRRAHPDANRPTRDMDPAALARLVTEGARRSSPVLTRDMDPTLLAQLVAEVQAEGVPATNQLMATSSDVEVDVEVEIVDRVPPPFLRIDVTTPIDISELISIRPQTMPIDYAQILATLPVTGTAMPPRRGWLGRVWDALTRRGTRSLANQN